MEAALVRSGQAGGSRVSAAKCRGWSNRGRPDAPDGARPDLRAPPFQAPGEAGQHRMAGAERQQVCRQRSEERRLPGARQPGHADADGAPGQAGEREVWRQARWTSSTL